MVRASTLVLNSTDVRRFADGFVPGGVARRSPDVSPLYADPFGSR
jgi:acetyl esterase